MLSEMGNLNTVSHWSNCRNHKAPLAGLSPFLMAANTFVYCSTVEADSSVFVVILNLCCHLLSHRDYNYAILASHFPVQSWANMTLSTKLDIHNDASREGLIPGHRQHAQKILWSLYVNVWFLYLPSEWSETDRDYVFTFVSVCAHSVPLVWLGGMLRNVFDSCVKSWEYFRTDNISLETSFYWLSDDIVRFKIEVELRSNVEKCNTISDDLAS